MGVKGVSLHAIWSYHLLPYRPRLGDDRGQFARVYKERDIAPIAGWAGRPPEHRRLVWRLGQRRHARAHAIAPGEPSWRDVHTQREEVGGRGTEIRPGQERPFRRIPRKAHH